MDVGIWDPVVTWLSNDVSLSLSLSFSLSLILSLSRCPVVSSSCFLLPRVLYVRGLQKEKLQSKDVCDMI